MLIREELEKIEEETLSKYATLSKNSLGRAIFEEECNVRTCFMRDRDRIVHSNAFKRLKKKTQVFIIPESDHYITRLTHTLEVSQIGRTIAKALKLNEDLVEAIALGHDLGHTPFGHAGEKVLNNLLKNGFEHCIQSVRICEKLEKNGRGLNLTKEVLDGILNHRTKGNPITLEGKIVQASDKIAYINHDIEDAISAGIITNNDIPKNVVQILGDNYRKRIDTLVRSIIENSKNINDIKMSEEIKTSFIEIRDWMFDKVYLAENKKAEEKKAENLIVSLFEYYSKNIDKMPKEFIDLIEKGEEKEQVVSDYISGMTDDYAIYKFENLFVPKGLKLEHD